MFFVRGDTGGRKSEKGCEKKKRKRVKGWGKVTRTKRGGGWDVWDTRGALLGFP